MKTNLVWITPHAEALLGKMARVSNPANQDNPDVVGLIRYMIRHKHWSPFEMVSSCFEIETTRDIGRQILRHRSFSFQEFSQRYADVNDLPAPSMRECRIQDTKNRQSSHPCADDETDNLWWHAQKDVYDTAHDRYQAALKAGIAKEQARALLPEGLTPSRMYMAGTLRSWMHYCELRSGPETQKEHREIAKSISHKLSELVPTVWSAMEMNHDQ
jgi:thymidylate synthase (FAD)